MPRLSKITIKMPGSKEDRDSLFGKLNEKRYQKNTTFQDVGYELFSQWLSGERIVVATQTKSGVSSSDRKEVRVKQGTESEWQEIVDAFEEEGGGGTEELLSLVRRLIRRRTDELLEQRRVNTKGRTDKGSKS